MEDLAGQVSYMQVMILNATGKLPERKFADWCEAVYICMSWPDPRIWCNHVGALGGTLGASTVASTCAGLMTMESKLYGGKSLMEGARFIQLALQKYKNGQSVENILKEELHRTKGKCNVAGYARPIVKGDVRIEVLEHLAKKLGFSRGEHLALAFKIEECLSRDFGENMYISGYVSAFLSDQNLSAQEVYRAGSILVASGVTACHAEEESKPAGSFLPLRCDDIIYTGTPPRSLPSFQ